MSMFHLYSIFCIYIFVILKVSTAENADCSGIFCYNGGTLEFEDGLCKCRCPPQTTGLLCAQDMKSSKWPQGPYALPMVSDGCPEDGDRGWLINRIKITTEYPMTERASYHGCADISYESPMYDTLIHDMYGHISGYFDMYELQVNLCHRLPEYLSGVNAHWPEGNYSIYGVNHACPIDFDAQNVTICLPPIRTFEQLESLPTVFSILDQDDENKTYLQVTICTRRAEMGDEKHDIWLAERPFSLLKRKDMECADLNGGYWLSRRSLSTYVPVANRWLLNVQPLNFCFFYPETYRAGGKSDYWKLNKDLLRERFQGNYALMYVGVTYEDILCENKPKGLPSTDCYEMNIVTLDAYRAVNVVGMLVVFDSVTSQYRFRMHRTFFYILMSNKRIYTSVSDSVMCIYNEISWENTETDLVVVLNCTRTFQARFVTIYTTGSILENTFITILSRKSLESTADNSDDVVEFGVTSCYNDIGIRDFGIQDFQFQASSSQTSHDANQARPQENGWCAELGDLEPYLQIDFLSTTVIEGVIFYTWFEIENNKYRNRNNYTMHVHGLQPIDLEYAVSYDTFFRYNHRPLVTDLPHEIYEQRSILFETPFIARYLRVYPHEDGTQKSICIKMEVLGCRNEDAFPLPPVYFDLFNDNILNIYNSEIKVIDSVTFAASDFSFTNMDNRVFNWNIHTTSGQYLHIQFTDIALRPPEKGQNFRNSDMCEDLLIVTKDDNPTRKVSRDEPFGYDAVFDHRYNGNYPSVRVLSQTMILEFRTCSQQQNSSGDTRGFTVIIVEEDSNPPCKWYELCMFVPMTITTPNFLGQIMKPSTLYVWLFLNLIEPNTVMKVLDFDVSCSSGTTFTFLDLDKSPRTFMYFCNKNKTSLSVIPLGRMFDIRFITNTLSCGQNLFREGFHLSYEKGERSFDDSLNYLTSNQSEFKESQPIWSLYIVYPVQKKDILDTLPLNGFIRKVCSSHFNKCYTIYIGLKVFSPRDGIQLCEDRGKVVVNAKSKLELEYVKTIVLNRIAEIGSFAHAHLLIGLIRYVIGNRIRNYWMDGSIAQYTAWGENEPLINSGRLCTSMMLSNKGGWRTENCNTIDDFNIVCEETLESKGDSVKDRSPIYEVTFDQKSFTEYEHLFFGCNNGESVSRLARCNGIGECVDGSDEEGCLKERECDEDEFKCDISRCIHVSQMCDHIHDCNDFTDESCSFEPCLSPNFTCDGGVCHEDKERCDTIKHCKDGTDEINCDFCGSNRVTECGLNKICLPEYTVCNGVVDCDDGSDEIYCKPETRTCDDYIGREFSTDENLECEFELDSSTNLIQQKMTFLNIDWSFIKAAEYNINSHSFLMFSLKSGYNCSQKFTKEARRDKQLLDQLLNISRYDHEQLDFIYSLPNTIDTEFSVIAKTDTFEVEFTQDNLILRYYDIFDTAKNRIAFGPLECLKEISVDASIFCGDGLRSISEDLRCVYEVDDEFNNQGCVNLNHLDNCTNYICPDQYIKCPHSYCILPQKVCDGRMDCPNGEDEQQCWCEAEDKLFLILQDQHVDDEAEQLACQLAGELFSQGQTVMFIDYRTDAMLQLNGQLFYSSAGHCLVHDYYRYVPNMNPNVWFGSGWSIDPLEMYHKVWNSTKSSVLLWMTNERLNERELGTSNYLKWVLESLGSNVSVYNMRSDPTIQSNMEIVPSAVTEILVRNWELIDSIGPWLLKDECREIQNSSCTGGYRCLRSRVCLKLDQICDGNNNCPHSDDEMNCDFLCPSFCSCGLLKMKCEEKSSMNISVFDLHIHFSTRILDLSNTNTFGKDFLMLDRSDVPFRYLFTLNVSNCEIPIVRHSFFYRMKNLRTLDLSHNRIRRLTDYIFSNLTELTSLFLHGNSLLSYIEPGSFYGLKIRSLDLTGCSILSISKNTFVGLILDYLDISFNKIDTIEDLAFNSLATRQLKLQGNRINQFSKKMFDGIQSVELLNTPAFKFCCIRPSYLEETSCLPYKDEFSSCADLMRNPIMQALLWVIGSLALLGNIASLVYRIYFDKNRLKIGYGIFVTNLALSDMFMGIYMLIIAVADNIFRGRYIEVDTYWRSSSWCTLAGVLSTLSSEASVFFVAFITIDRILVIKFPFGNVRITSHRAIATSILIWIFVAFLSILPVLYVDYFSDRFYGKSAVCLALPLTRDRPPGWIYSFGVFVGFNFVMFVLIALGQLLIYLEIKKQTNMTKHMNVSRRNDLTVARNLLLLVSTDFLCWFPIGVMGLMALDGYVVPGGVYAWTAVLVLPINSALNPFLYTLSAIMNKKSFNPSVDEQRHENIRKSAAISILRIASYFHHGSLKFRYDHDLLNIHETRPLLRQEVLLIVRDLAKGLSILHEEDLVMKNFDSKSIGVRLSLNMVKKTYFSQLPHVMKNKEEKPEDIYKFGLLIRECIKRQTRF